MNSSHDPVLVAQWVKNLPAVPETQEDVGSVPGPGVLLENLMDRGAWRAVVPGIAELDTTEWLMLFKNYLLIFGHAGSSLL